MVMGDCASFPWVIVGGCVWLWVAMGGCGWLWVIVGDCG